MEFVGAFDITQAEIAIAGANNPVEREIPIPIGASRWTLIVVPKSVGAADNPTLTLQHDVGGVFFGITPAVSVAAVINTSNALNREEAVSRVKVILTNPAANLQDGDTLVRLFMSRGGS